MINSETKNKLNEAKGDQETIGQGKNSAYEVDIAGAKLKLKTSNSPEKVTQLVELVNKEVLAALNATQTRSLQNAALVAALNLAEELLRVKEITRSELDTLKSQAESIVSELESTQFSQLDH